MLLRVRSNVGTWKYSMEPSDLASDIVRRVQNGNGKAPPPPPPSLSSSSSWTITQPLSWDPSGTHTLTLDRSLEELGVSHGTMIYCRVESSSRSAGSKEHTEDSLPSMGVLASYDYNDDHDGGGEYVIDLLDSSDDDENIPAAKPATSNPKKRPRQSSPGLSTPKKKMSGSKVASLTTNSHPSKFQIASYNVWFGPPDPSARLVHPEQRMAAIAQELQSCQDNLLIIGFQEITETLRDYLEPHLKGMGYRFCTQPLNGAYGVGLAISKQVEMIESKFLPYDDSSQGRGLLYVQTPTMLFATTHLESFINAEKNYNGATQREAQIVQAANFCQERMSQYPNLRLAMIAGDFNWDDERKRKNTCPNTPLLSLLEMKQCGTWKDSGTPLDYTYDSKENPMLRGSLRRRFDRCIYSTNTSEHTVEITNAIQLHKLGREAIPNLIWDKKNPYDGTTKPVEVAPSDHFGIAVTFKTK